MTATEPPFDPFTAILSDAIGAKASYRELFDAMERGDDDAARSMLDRLHMTPAELDRLLKAKGAEWHRRRDSQETARQRCEATKKKNAARTQDTHKRPRDLTASEWEDEKRAFARDYNRTLAENQRSIDQLKPGIDRADAVLRELTRLTTILVAYRRRTKELSTVRDRFAPGAAQAGVLINP